MVTTTKTLKFFYNGIKANGGKLQKVWYSLGNTIDYPGKSTITIYKKDHVEFSKEVHEAFKVENNTDMMTDYFEKDKIYVAAGHELYAEVLEAAEKHEAHMKKTMTKR